MTNQTFGGILAERPATFGRRKIAPRVCVVDAKRHLRAFLTDVLEDLGFVTSECAKDGDLGAILETQLPDLIVIGLSVDGIEAGKILEVLVRREFCGKVLAIGARESIIVKAVQQVGEEYGLVMLPPVTTPFAAGTLRERVAMLVPEEPAPSPAVHVEEALHAGWLELWYQPKIDARTLVRCGAEALVRMRHPTWGVVPPAYFIPENDDPDFLRLSEFVINRAIEDWHHLLEQQGATDISINLPVSFLKNPDAVRDLCHRVPAHPAFGGLLIEISSAEAIHNLDLLIDVARELRLHNIAVSIDDLGTDWPALMELRTFPFVELKVDRQFVTGCASDRLKRTVCRRIIELAKGYGVRVVAEGVETRADFVAANELGFDLVQGYLFGKPMGLKKFARSAMAPSVLASK
ncbi:response regulator receiver modulated diguanylate phosphodiesterase [Bradyrhizobium lablabi]|uniref:Response regulator receiver modulated diguanylate phosphodiesterase n=1 Tax=Bradyrhizobium lablabi TaxID=722472 RepID=A0A1M6VIJ9_9BRAD|nr:EAL domain-containing response regulator [Bradyrhizobium lablabi]SHK81174.1 response regulator receiver modulated diguanylate phosphodiesterase [Bradyrhizobium lablabi]